MPITVKHSKVSTIPDDADTDLVRPSDWNADHTLTGLGTMAEQNANNVNITGGSITGVTGLGDVTGPASSTDNAIARFDSTTGKLLQNSVVAVGDTGAVTGVTTLAASTSVTTPIVQATNSAGLALRNSAGTAQISMGAGGGDNVTIAVATNINGANAQIDISPTGTGHVHIKPTGSGSLEIAPTNAGTMNNMVIGGTTPLAGSFTNLSVTGTTSFDGSQGTAGQVLTSAGAGNTPTWATPSGSGTVTSITAGSGLSGGTITTSGTIALDINGLSSTTVVADDLVPVYDVSASANADCLASDIAGLGVGSIGYKNSFYYFPYLMSSIGTTTTAVANRLYYLPFFVRKKTTFTRIGIQIVVLGGTSARLGIYNAANGIPTSLLLDCGTISTASSGEKEATISQSLNTGFYFLAFVADGTPVIQITTNISQASSYAVGQFVRDNISYGYFASNGSITLPSTATSLQDATTTPAVSLRVV